MAGYRYNAIHVELPKVVLTQHNTPFFFIGKKLLLFSTHTRIHLHALARTRTVSP